HRFYPPFVPMQPACPSPAARPPEKRPPTVPRSPCRGRPPAARGRARGRGGFPPRTGTTALLPQSGPSAWPGLQYAQPYTHSPPATPPPRPFLAITSGRPNEPIAASRDGPVPVPSGRQRGRPPDHRVDGQVQGRRRQGLPRTHGLKPLQLVQGQVQ